MPLIQRLTLALVAAGLLAAAAVAVRWTAIDRLAVDAEAVLARRYGGTATESDFDAARAGLDALIELRGHPAYLDRQARFELEAGGRARNEDPVRAFEHFRRAETLALAAHAERPGLPHALLRAAAARAERFQIDETFEGYLRDAHRIGPWDRGVLRTTVLLVLWHWQVAPKHLREFALDRAEEAWRASQARGLAAVVSRANGWPAFCQRETIREHNRRHCRRYEQSG